MNLVYDAPFDADGQPETTARIRYCRWEFPDCVILSHSDNGLLVQEPRTFIPTHDRQRSDPVAAVVGARCAREGFKNFRVPQAPMASSGEGLYQSDAVYHASGAVPLVFEFACGGQTVLDTHRAILDIGVTVLEEIAAFGNRYRFRPRGISRVK